MQIRRNPNSLLGDITRHQKPFAWLCRLFNVGVKAFSSLTIKSEPVVANAKPMSGFPQRKASLGASGTFRRMESEATTPWALSTRTEKVKNCHPSQNLALWRQ